MNNTVYVCYIGEQYASDDIAIVFGSEEKAIRWVEEQEKRQDFYRYADYYTMEVF